MDLGRRQVVQTGAAAAAVAPFLQNMPASAANRDAKAPVITIFDHRGCKRGGPDAEYKGLKANSKDDEMCVKVQSVKISVSEAEAAKSLQEFISFTSKGLDGKYNGPRGK
jgi:hypothetical protein